MWWIFALCSAFFAAATAIFAKMGIRNINTDLAIAIRTTVVLFLTWGIAFFRGGTENILSISKQNLLFLALSGITTGLSWVFYFKAIEIGKVSEVAPVDKLSLALTIIFSVIFLGESLTAKTALGAALILAGTLIVILQ